MKNTIPATVIIFTAVLMTIGGMSDVGENTSTVTEPRHYVSDRQPGDTASSGDRDDHQRPGRSVANRSDRSSGDSDERRSYQQPGQREGVQRYHFAVNPNEPTDGEEDGDARRPSADEGRTEPTYLASLQLAHTRVGLLSDDHLLAIERGRRLWR